MLVGDRPMNGDRNGVPDTWCTPFISPCNPAAQANGVFYYKIGFGTPHVEWTSSRECMVGMEPHEARESIDQVTDLRESVTVGLNIVAS